MFYRKRIKMHVISWKHIPYTFIQRIESVVFYFQKGKKWFEIRLNKQLNSSSYETRFCDLESTKFVESWKSTNRNPNLKFGIIFPRRLELLMGSGKTFPVLRMTYIRANVKKIRFIFETGRMIFHFYRPDAPFFMIHGTEMCFLKYIMTGKYSYFQYENAPCQMSQWATFVWKRLRLPSDLDTWPLNLI